PAVRFQLAFTFGEWASGGDLLSEIYLQGRSSAELRLAVLSSAGQHSQALLAAARNANDGEAIVILQRLATNAVSVVAPIRMIVETNSMTPVRRAARQQALEKYSGVTQMKGDSKHGAELFKQSCAT